MLTRACAAGLSLIVVAAVAQEGSGPAVELSVATSERAARVVARAMRSGFFVDQLLIPDTHYMGRHAWSTLNPGMQRTLAEATPGEVFLFPLDSGNTVVARIVPDGPPAILGGDRFARESKEIWAVLSVGPTDSRLLSMEIDEETGDLAAICASRRRWIEDELRTARAEVAALPAAAPASALVGPYGDLISLLSFQGEMRQAIEVVGALAERLQAQGPSVPASHLNTLDLVLGILELRRGEAENCLYDHHREMCLFPLSAAARHRLDDGASRAFEHFARYLERAPDDLEARWLLNIAAMTLGRYPDALPDRHRIGPESFASPVDPGRFWDVAAPAGLTHSDNAGGSVADDFDGDGLLDLVVSSRDPCEPLRYYRSLGDGTFADRTESAGLGGQLGGLNVAQVDYDGDGRLDLFVMRGGWETAIRNSLLRNRAAPDGAVVFEDVTAAAGLGGPAHRTQSAAWADVDGDGDLDLFVANELSFSQLYRNRGDGTFEEATVEAGLRFRSLSKGASWSDVDNDGRPDLYVSNFGERNLLFVNRGAGRFEEVALAAGVAEPTYSFTTWFWDYDNDGWQDLLVVTLRQTVDEVAREYLGEPQRGETLRVYRNRGDGTFEDATSALDLARNIPTMGANFGDLDNDGFLDVYLGTGAPSYGMLVPNRAFLNQGGERFVDVTTATGTGHLQKGHGVAFADFDNDGDQELFANIGGAFPGDKYPNALFENPGHGNDWLRVELVGTRNHPSALGARLRVVVESDGRERSIHRAVTSGGSFGASPLEQHVGLGPDAASVRLEVDWPTVAGDDGPRRQLIGEVPKNSAIRVTEGVDGFELVPLRRLAFPAGAHTGHGPRSSASPGG